jgi:hypothetical protein
VYSSPEAASKAQAQIEADSTNLPKVECGGGAPCTNATWQNGSALFEVMAPDANAFMNDFNL